MKFCPSCAHPLEQRTPTGDQRPRYCCAGCGGIQYENPKLVVGTVPVWGNRVLLCRRAIEPSYGLWTLPAGFMENDESTAQGALRETQEEAGARVVLLGLFSLIDVEVARQVHLYYRAQLLDLDFSPGDETLELGLFGEEDIPWDTLAFQSVTLTLRAYFADANRNQWGVHTGSVASMLQRVSCA